MSTQVLARKWRPHNFQTMVGQQHVVTALANALKQQRLHHAYLFTGTRGVGKTTVARILAKCLNCETGITAEPCDQCDACTEINQGRFMDLYEVDAASRTKVEDTRDLLDNVQYAPSKGRFKVYLIDEVHMLSGHSFNALLKTLEEPPAHVKFLLATTDPQKLPATVLSRCLQFHMKNLTIEQIAGHLKNILEQEQIPFEVNALERLGRAANGSMRDALSLLDQAIAFGDNNVTMNAVNNMLGAIDHNNLTPLFTALIESNAQLIFETINQLSEYGVDFANVLEELLSLMHQIAILQALSETGNSFVEHADVAKKFAQQFTAEELQLYYQIGLIGRRDLPLAPTPKSGFEMLLLRMLAFKPTTMKASNLNTTTATSTKTTTTSSASPSTKTVAQKTTSQTTNTQPSNNWNEIIEHLNLKGPSLAVAQHCTMTSMTDTEITLQIEPKHAVLLNKNLEKRIEQSIYSYFNKPIKLVVNVTADSSSKQQTPAAQKASIEAQKQSAAEKEIHNDQNIKEIVETFNATILTDSIESK